MNNVSRFLTAIAFSFAGVAAHANSAVEQNSCAGSTCFQLSPVAKQGSDALIAADGASHTPQGQMVAADGSSHTPQGQTVAENGASRTPQSQWLDSQTA
ncbi:hypothetical protein C1X59_26830 [Pseudomonas sp. FW215-R2]|jgi:hypothetical protein|uniref:hypothetical protein n=1 Tax=unclassified Pseudomonas TaxID=196821 RepID=UPI000C88CC34|nr:MULTISPECIES: hypothetical protein [unclassified Pseudomonas]PMW95329.1 hypothetical protein C1X59_26830 [Pseudomonas sp. FW215-R2]PMX13158.1 hypothetical protein C1X60_02175 [Pseudomonas sp. FW215-L1]PMX24333.1 hypothetical protein C1X57_07790 [Pseudomonas sp. FW215-E1]PNA23541.1 hypothetical protein C1X58_25385 [Pseudomonas sp. FW215-R4]